MKMMKLSKKQNKFKLNLNFNVFYLMRLIGRNYINNYFSLFLDFIMPALVMLLIFAIFDAQKSSLSVVGIILSAVATSSCFSFAICYSKWKTSIIIKKIRISQLSIIQLFISFIVFYFFISLFAFLFSLCLAIILEQINSEKIAVTGILKNLNYGYILFSLFLLILSGCSFGFFLATISRKTNDAVGLAFGFFLMQAFILGYYLDLSTVNSQETVRYISYALPLFGPSRLFQLIWFENYNLTIPDVINGGTKEVSFIKDFSVVSISDLTKPETVYNSLHFAKNYWSLVLLAFANITFYSTVTIFISSRQKFN